MPIIKVLDTDTVNKIAAGEVVARPVSVIKELVENSLDAQAKSIKIEITESGKNLIRVIDDGCGMDKEDAALCLHRHATSKINTADDLHTISTMGFRGEAIASIAAVSEFSLVTRKNSDELGTEIKLIDKGILQTNRIHTSVGTTVTVKNLFYNVPARLKFLKSDKTELIQIIKFVQAISLAFTNVSFVLVSDNKKIFGTTGNDDIKSVLFEVMNIDVEKNLKYFEHLSPDISICGYISNPSICRMDRDKQIFIVNNRVVQSDIIAKAVRNSVYYIYPSQRYPYLFINIQVNPVTLDVNVHPSKLEVKFANESELFKAIQQALRFAFKIVLPPQTFYHKESSAVSFNSLQNLYKPENGLQINKKDDLQAMINAQSLLGLENNNQPPFVTLGDEYPINFQQNNSVKREILQLNNTYLVYWGNNQLLIIDQHIAHERVIYEKLKKGNKMVLSQELLLPETLFCDKVDSILLSELLLVFESIGFKLEEFGTGTYLIRAVPVILANKAVKAIITDLLDSLKEKSKISLVERIYINLACKSAVKAGDFLNITEREELLNDWMNTENNMSCPHGRPIVKMFDLSEVERWFNR